MGDCSKTLSHHRECAESLSALRQSPRQLCPSNDASAQLVCNSVTSTKAEHQQTLSNMAAADHLPRLDLGVILRDGVREVVTEILSTVETFTTS